MAEIDPNLFRQATQGDRDAFWKLVLPYRGLVYSVAIGMLRNHERAEDALHDVLLQAFRSLPNLRDSEKFPSWLYSITRYHILDVMRREGRLRRATLGTARLAEIVPVSELDIAEKEESLDRLAQALDQLPEPFRVILGLKYTNDYSCQEMAKILDISVTAVKSRLFEARNLLRQKTEALSADGGKEQDHEMR